MVGEVALTGSLLTLPLPLDAPPFPVIDDASVASPGGVGGAVNANGGADLNGVEGGDTPGPQFEGKGMD